MNILIIHGSPRRGNTWNIVNQIRDKINEEINANYEIIELSKMKIPICTGCFNCILESEETCPHYESIKYITDKINWCDALIITSPVYSFQVSSQLKNFIEHMSYNLHRPRYFNKKALIITTTAESKSKDVCNYIEKVLTYWGINTIYKLPVLYINDNFKFYEKEINKLSKKFIHNLKSEKFKVPSFKVVAKYNYLKAKSMSLYTKNNINYEYWQKNELYKYPYNPDINIGIIKSVFGNLVYKLSLYKIKNSKKWIKYNKRKTKIIKRIFEEKEFNL